MNKRVEEIEISGIRKFFNKVRKVEGAISLTLGQPDFKCPKRIKEAMIKAIENDKTTYTENEGILELREEISKNLQKNNINYDSSEICITVGGSEGLYSTFSAIINSGDKILVPTPGYPAYESICKILGGELIFYELENGFILNTEKIKEAILREKIKILVLSFPSNPTGAILNSREKDELVSIIKETGVIVITDEIYSSICYKDYVSVAQNIEIKNNIIYISGFSKMFSVTGLRVGFVACANIYMKEIMKVHQYNVSCATSLAQYGVLEGLKYCSEDVENMKRILKKRREYVVNRIRKIGLEVNNPEGAFYVFPSIKKLNISSEEFCYGLLKESKVACVPGNAFGVGGEGYFRISYCYSIEELKEALDKIELYIESLRSRKNDEA
ncbi:aminotransferase class I/II-fold pyridoxal phosphate-dependent enzyme [Clostridium carnis]